MIDLQSIDILIQAEVESKYAGFEIKSYASGMGGGVRDVAYDVILKDGSRFVVDALYDIESNKLTLKEREYVE